jgi:hypothetical protein
MTPIRKFIEALDYGRVGNRSCYVERTSALPPSRPGSHWREDVLFDEARELARSTNFERVVQAARSGGYVLVERPE